MRRPAPKYFGWGAGMGGAAGRHEADAVGGGHLAGAPDATNTAGPVWADTAYRAERNLSALQRRGLSERLQFRRPPHRSLSGPRAMANAAWARVRSAIEHVFARLWYSP
jgi:hypothetical protein